MLFTCPFYTEDMLWKIDGIVHYCWHSLLSILYTLLCMTYIRLMKGELFRAYFNEQLANLPS